MGFYAAQPGRLQMTKWRIACWVPTATTTQSEYVIFIAFPLQQWLHERTSMLRYSTLPVLLILDNEHFLLCNEHITRCHHYVRPFTGGFFLS